MNTKNLPDLTISDEELTVQELREHYQKIVNEYGKVVDNARSQLERIEAFLQDLSGLKLPSPASSKNSSTTTAPKASASRAAKAKLAKSQATATKKPKAAIAKTGRGRKKKVSLKLQGDYQKLTLIAAIAKVLEAREGKIVNADEVVKALYGELKPNDHKVAKDRVTKNLSKGKTEGRWARLPDQLGAYTWDLDTVKEG
jgi:ribosomal protein L12E/L44/L45/RPP1/RPP2